MVYNDATKYRENDLKRTAVLFYSSATKIWNISSC